MGTRHPFGGGIADWVFQADSAGVPTLQAGAAVVAYATRESATPLILALDPAGATQVTGVTTSDGTDGYGLGEIPIFYGPDDVTYLWISADGGPRVAIGSLDSADLAGAIAAQFAQHVSQVNPHQTKMGDLADADFPGSVPAGAVPVWNATSGKWEVSTSTGLNPNAFVSVAGGSVVRVAEGNTTTIGEEIRTPAGNRDTAANAWQASWNAGTSSVPSWALGFYLNGYAEGRARATRDTGVAFRIERRSSGATADLLQVVDQAGAVLAWINSKGQVRAPNLGRSIPFTALGAITANPGRFSWWNDTGTDLILRSIRFSLNTAGSTTSTFDVNDNGTTLYPSTKPQLAAAATTALYSTSFTIVAGHKITVDIDAAGTGAQDLTCQLELY